MVSYVTPILEFSRDPISDATPTWVDVTAYLLSARWASGIQEPGGEPQAGFAEFVLDDRTRRFEPEYSGGAYYPDVVPMRRFRWRITSSAVTYEEGIWYATRWQPEWPGEAMNQETTVQCVDGFGVLALDDLPFMDPPDAGEYADVVDSDGPWGYWRLGEAAGTKMVVVTRRGKKRGHNGKRRKVRVRRRVTAAALEGATGTSGTYINTPELAKPSLILGDDDTSVVFGLKGDTLVGYGRVPVEDHEFSEGNAFTVSCWANRVQPYVSDRVFLAGPYDTDSTANIFTLAVKATTHLVEYKVQLTGGAVTLTSTTAIPAGDAPGMHVVAVWDSVFAKLYINGVLEDIDGTGNGRLRICDANEFFYLGTKSTPLSESFMNLDEVSAYEHALTDDRIYAHYEAGALRGWPQQTAGERVADIATHALWSEANIQTSGRQVVPAFKTGQQKLDEVTELAHSEGPKTLFYFNGTGNPEYRGHEWQATDAQYYTLQATIGNNATLGEAPYENTDLEYDDEIYNEVTASREDGELVTVADTAAADKYGRRVNTEFTDVLLADETEVESLASHVLAYYLQPSFRPVSIAFTGEDTLTRAHIFARKIGHLIQFKHRPKFGTSVNRICHIIGWEKSLARETGRLECVWHLDRGFDAGVSPSLWHAGISPFSEAGVTTRAA